MEYPYLLILETVLNANGTGTVSYPLPTNETLQLSQIMQTSTGAFNVTGIHTSDGQNYTNASNSVEIPSTLIPSGANNNNNLGSFPIPLLIRGGVTFYVDLEDTSGAGNTVTLVFSGVRNNGA